MTQLKSYQYGLAQGNQQLFYVIQKYSQTESMI